MGNFLHKSWKTSYRSAKSANTWFLAIPIRYLAHVMYFGVPGRCGTSVRSERLFSKAAEVVAARRSNIKPKNVDMILFLNKNLLCSSVVQ